MVTMRRDLPAGPSIVTPTKKKEKDKTQKWSREDYKEVMYAFYMSLEKPWVKVIIMLIMILQGITLSCLIPVSMKIVKLTTVTLKNERVIKLEKKTMMLSIICLKTKLLRLSKKLKLSV